MSTFFSGTDHFKHAWLRRSIQEGCDTGKVYRYYCLKKDAVYSKETRLQDYDSNLKRMLQIVKVLKTCVLDCLIIGSNTHAEKCII